MTLSLCSSLFSLNHDLFTIQNEHTLLRGLALQTAAAEVVPHIGECRQVCVDGRALGMAVVGVVTFLRTA